MKKLFSLVLACVLLMSISISVVSAMPALCYYGDANTDNHSDIVDATFIQRSLAEFFVMSPLQEKMSDVDADGEVTVVDATMIQQKLARIIREYPAGLGIYAYVTISDFISDAGDSQQAVVGDTVIFTTEAYGEYEPLVYDYYVNNELVIENSSSNIFTHSFDESGEYIVEVVVSNTLDVTTSAVERLFVIDSE